MTEAERIAAERRIIDRPPAKFAGRPVGRPDPSVVGSGRNANRWRIPMILGWVLALSVLIAPLPLSFPTPTLDTLWGAAMNQAFVHRFAWGTQIIWTYGPYGFLDSTAYYYSSTWIWSFIATVAISVAFLTTLALFLINLKGPWWTWLAMGAALLLPISRSLVVGTELLLIVMFLLHLAVTSRWRVAILFTIPAGFCFALVVLVKGNNAAGALGVTACFIAVAPLMRRWRAILAYVASSVTSLVVLWIPTAPLSSLPAYLRSMYEVVIGYSAAMSVFIEEDTISAQYARFELLLAAVILLVAGITVVAMVLARDIRGFSLALLAVPVIFVTYKEVFVRYGPDRLPVLYGVVIVVSLPILLYSVRSNLSWPTRLAPGFSLALCTVLLMGLGSAQLQTPVSPGPLSDLQTRFLAYQQSEQLLASPALRSEANARAAKAFQAGYHFSPQFLAELHHGTFVAYPIDAAVAYGYKLDWDPTPIFQSYQGYRPYLDNFDAAHFRSRNGPYHVLFALFGMDGRYPLFDEPATVRALVYCYRVVDSDGPYLLLQRRAPICTEPRLHRLNTVVASLGSFVSVPRTGSHVYADVEIHYSPVGELANLAYRPSELHIQFQYGLGETSTEYRYIPAVGPDGLLVSSYVSSITDFQRVMADEPGTPIDGLRIAAGTGREYDRDITVTFYTDSAT